MRGHTTKTSVALTFVALEKRHEILFVSREARPPAARDGEPKVDNTTVEICFTNMIVWAMGMLRQKYIACSFY